MGMISNSFHNCLYFFWQPCFPVPFSVTLIDTPGLGDTGGIKNDKIIGIDSIHAVSFVVQSAIPRLTETQQYIFDSVLKIFGRDIEFNIVFIATFADAGEPDVLYAIKNARIPVNHLSKFNNSALYCKTNTEESEINKLFWNIGQRGYQDLFSFIGKAQPKNLALTTKVLHKRKEIHIRIDGLTRLMKQGQNKLNELKSIAIKASSLSEMDYIKLQIKGEQERKQFGWEDRVAWLKEVIEQVQLIHDISEGKTNQKIIELEDRTKNFSKMQSASKQMNIERSN